MASFDYHINPLYPIKECSSCGALYTMEYCCSEGSLRDKIICDLNKTPDLFKEPSQNCPKCGNPVDGHCCQGCVLLRKKFKEDLFTYCIENRILQDSSEPFNDNTNVVNALQEPFIDSLFDEFSGELTLLKSIPSGINETDCDPKEENHLIKRFLYDKLSPRPPKEFISENSDTAFESFSPFPIPVEDSDSFMKEIDLSFTLNDPMPPSIEEDDYESKRDVLILEELLNNDSLSLPENESFHFDSPSSSRPPAKPPDGNSGISNVKVMGDIYEHKVPMPRLMLTQPTFVPNQEKSLDLLSYLGHEAF
nr:hypothetical protein [Tanacetum cinerariifolium]